MEKIITYILKNLADQRLVACLFRLPLYHSNIKKFGDTSCQVHKVQAHSKKTPLF